MKKLLTLCLVLYVQSGYGQVNTGETVPELQFNTVLNAPLKSVRLSDLKGKLVLLDFWATWCGSCLVAMPHLQALQTKYHGKLQVIAVGDETLKRTSQYLHTKPSNLWFAIDTARQAAAAFPHQLIPHDILIGPDGKLIAATSPENITDAVIDSLLAGSAVHLPEKKDNMLSYEELIKQNFDAADTVQRRFMIQGEIKGGSGLTNNWLDKPAFAGRRLTCINLPLTTLYMVAYNHFPYGRTIDQVKAGWNAPRYCLDLIVRHADELLPALRKELSARFDLQARIDPMVKEVQVLRITDPEKFRAVPRNTSGKRTYMAMHGMIDQQAMTMTDFAQFLEDYGTGKLTVDQTANLEKFDMKFSWQPENPQSLLDILASLGLGLTKEQRTVDMLVLYKQ